MFKIMFRKQKLIFYESLSINDDKQHPSPDRKQYTVIEYIYQTNGRRLCEACNSSNIIVNKTKTINKLNQLQTKLCRRPFWKYPDDTLFFLSRRRKQL